MDLLDSAPSHSAQLDAKARIEVGDQPSSSESLIVASATRLEDEFRDQDGAAVDSGPTRAAKFVASNGLSFSRYTSHHRIVYEVIRFANTCIYFLLDT